MVGTTLVELREHVESLASDGGSYYVVCGRTGEQPIPAAGKRFADRTAAASAARATEQYRSALRRYDPRVPYYDLVVCEETGPLTDADADRSAADARATTGATDDALSDRIVDGTGPQPARRRRTEYCHRVAAAAFESLSAAGHDVVETAVMDAYFALAETVTDRDELCLRLLESMATEFDDRLSPREQADLLARAGSRLGPAHVDGAPVTATLATLRRRGLVGPFACSQAPVGSDGDGAGRSVVVSVADYALSPRHGRLPVVPVVVELYRRQPRREPTALRVDHDGREDRGDDNDCSPDGHDDHGWYLTVELGGEVEPTGLAAAPISPGNGGRKG